MAAENKNKMKNSGLEWIEGLPETWQEIPNRYLFIDHSVKVGEQWKDYQLLSLTTSGVKEKDVNAGGGKVPDSYENYQTVEIGDMIFCLFDLDCSAVFSGLSNYNGMITSAYDVFMPNSKYLNNLYADYWFQYVFSNRYYKMYSKNIRYTVTTEMFKSILTPIPPLDEQRKIGEFLLEKDKQIAELIANQQAQIEKLKEYKQSVITEAVTKGLDKSAPLKPSGIEWIGEIPAHWEVSNLGNLLKEHKQPNDEVNSNALQFKFGTIIRKKEQNLTPDVVEMLSKYNIVEPNIIMVNGLNLAFDFVTQRVAIVEEEGVITSTYLAMKPTSLANPKYFTYLLKSYDYQKALHAMGRGLRSVLSYEAFRKEKVLLPKLVEQQQIVDYLDEKCAKIDRLIAIKQEKIEKLQEYKKSLIYEYVTGKKEVG